LFSSFSQQMGLDIQYACKVLFSPLIYVRGNQRKFGSKSVLLLKQICWYEDYTKS